VIINYSTVTHINKQRTQRLDNQTNTECGSGAADMC